MKKLKEFLIGVAVALGLLVSIGGWVVWEIMLGICKRVYGWLQRRMHWKS